jgi:pimeloyl-ACP methyl ester carboxylesterase
MLASVFANPAGHALVVSTGFGPVEVVRSMRNGPVVLFFPGGHCSAATPIGADLYAELGFDVIVFSRPGYGRTDVGPLSAAEFVAAVRECCYYFGVTRAAAVVGVSFGGLQALHVATATDLASHLVLHSCAPSTRRFPDTRQERLVAPLVFGPTTGRATWAAVRALVASERGLQIMMGTLSHLPVATWWATWTVADQAAAVRTFEAMDSGTGFLNDVRQAEPDRARYRRLVQRGVACPTLITASRDDGGVAFAHAEDLADTIPGARLVETDAPSHFFWLGPPRRRVLEAVAGFLRQGSA